MGAINRCFEVSRSGLVNWDMFMEKRDTINHIWSPFPQYRVSYSSSLYPYCFSHRVVKDTLNDDIRTIVLRLYNTGKEKDQYSIVVKNQKSSTLAFKSSSIIKSESSMDISFSIHEQGPLHIEITSVNGFYTIKTIHSGF
jgi:hypothetical protein